MALLLLVNLSSLAGGQATSSTGSLGSTASTLSIQPPTLPAEAGSFTVDVVVTDVPNLVGYDFRLLYDTSVLTVVEASLDGTVFDNMPIFPVREDVFEGLGEIRYAIILAGAPPVMVTRAASLLMVTFRVDRLAGSILDLADDTLVVLLDGVATPWDHTTNDGQVIPPQSALSLRSVGCRAAIGGLNIEAHGTAQTVFCKLEYTGSSLAAPATARVEFEYASVGGATGRAFSPTRTLQLGETAILEATIVVPVAFDVFLVRGTVVRVVATPDGRIIEFPGESDTFKFNVRVCTSNECLV